MKKLSVFILTLLCVLCLTSCKKKIVLIQVVENSIPDVINVSELDSKISTIKLDVKNSKGKVETINLDKSMISTDDYAKLNTYGTYSVTVTYKELTTTLTLNIVTNNYVVKVVYPDNTPVTKGVNVQWCTGNNCFLPVKVNEQGLAEIELDNGNYYIHIEGIPAGYTYDPNAYTTDANNKFVEIKLISLSNVVSGEGTILQPYVIKEGTTNISFSETGVAGAKYFSFTPEVSGKYTIKSIAMDKLAMNEIDPYLGFLGNLLDMNQVDISGNIAGNINFSYEFEAEASKTYYFIVMVSSATSFPAEFGITISK